MRDFGLDWEPLDIIEKVLLDSSVFRNDIGGVALQGEASILE